MEELIRARLLDSGGVTTLAGTRIDYGGNPQGTALPRVCMWTVSGSEGLLTTGRDGIQSGRVQIDCYAATSKEALDLSRAVTNALHGHANGPLRMVSLVSFRGAMRESGTNEPDRPFRVTMDFSTLYLQP